MKLNIIKKTDKELKIEIEGVGHGFCNLLQKKLLEDEHVEQAGYDVPHPLASNPLIYVRMKNNKKPEEALISAAEKACDESRSFEAELTERLKV